LRTSAIDDTGTGFGSSHEFLRRSNTKVPVIGDVAGSAARTLTQVSFRVCLQTPRDAAKQELLVRRLRFFAEQLSIAFFQRRNLYVL